MRTIQTACLMIFILLLVMGIALPEGRCQYFGWPYIPFLPFQSSLLPLPYYYPRISGNFPLTQFSPVPISPASLVRGPNATIITTPGLTAVGTAPGVFVIGTPTAVNAAAVTPTTTAVATAAAPAPLFSILAVLYTSALYAPALLSTANPLLFAYLSTLLL